MNNPLNIDLSNVVLFPVKRVKTCTLVTEAEVRLPSRSETLIRTLDAVLTNMISMRGSDWTEQIINAAWARQMEELAKL